MIRRPEAEQDAPAPAGYDPDLYRLRHSAAHVMAQAVVDLFGGDGAVKLGIGPPIDNGFYYDFELPRPLTEQDLARIEARMREIIRADHPFVRRVIDEEEAARLFRNQPYKLELVSQLGQGAANEYGEANAAGDRAPELSVYEHDGFTDLCRGPHVASTGKIPPEGLKLLKVAGSYWRGVETRPMLQRVYGTAWASREALDHYLWQVEEAEKRDHRRLGKELELFHLDPTAPGMPYWLPKGLKLLNTLIDYWRRVHEEHGYQEIASPLINHVSLWVTSGHWEHYRESMFIIGPEGDYAVKPMNCPNAMVVFNLKTRSYRDLPLRLSDCDILHRNERSGTLHGLLRVQKLQQDDAHIFVTEDQVEAEYARILGLAEVFYRLFGLKYSLRLGTRPSKYLGEAATWDRAEAALRRILDRHLGAGTYAVLDGEGAFYGPKIDIMMEDALGRAWQMGTIQLDFQLPARFGCAYTDSSGAAVTPIVIHRVIYGSLERFIAILIEHTAGAFPVWLAPVQVRLIPIAERHVAYARQVLQTLRDAGLRAEVDDASERMNYRIRAAQLQKIPYMLVVGDREAATSQVAVRLRTGQDLGSMAVDAFVELAGRVVASKALDVR